MRKSRQGRVLPITVANLAAVRSRGSSRLPPNLFKKNQDLLQARDRSERNGPKFTQFALLLVSPCFEETASVKAFLAALGAKHQTWRISQSSHRKPLPACLFLRFFLKRV